LEAVAKEAPSTRLLKIDVDTWDSPVSEQFGIEELPTVYLYDGKQLVTDNTNEALAQLLE